MSCQGVRFLCLDFWGCDAINDEALGELSSQMKARLTGLTSFILVLNNCSQVMSNGVDSITEMFPCLKDLQILKLSYDDCEKLETKSVLFHIAEIGRNLPAIKSLELSFNSCPGVTDDVIKDLAKQVKSLSNLNILNLIFSYCKISNDAVLELTKQVGLCSGNICQFDLSIHGINILNMDSILDSLKAIAVPEIYADE